ncbi:MAG: ankyrin repeat domain-containing protein [Candidatus Sericytochromatia bacterium]
MDYLEKLLKSCLDDNIEEVISILDKDKSLLNKTKNSKGFNIPSLLQFTILGESFKVADYLLSIGLDINKKNFEGDLDCNAPIMHQIIIADSYEFEGTKYPEVINTKCLEYCIKNNININLEDDKGYTALDIALYYNHYTACELLSKNNGKHSKLYFKEYLFDLKSKKKSKSFYKIYPHLKNLEIYDCIETKCVFKNKKELPKYHYEINRSMNNYKNAPNYPLSLGFLNNEFIDYPYLINQKDYLGRTPLDFAIETKHDLAEKFLKEKGAKTSQELNHIEINDPKHDLLRQFIFELNFEKIKEIENIAKTINKIYKEKYIETASHELFFDNFDEEKREILEYFLNNEANFNIYSEIPCILIGAERCLQTNSNIERELLIDIIRFAIEKGYNKDLEDYRGKSLTKNYSWIIDKINIK